MVKSERVLTVFTALLLAAGCEVLSAAENTPTRDQLDAVTVSDEPPRSSRLRFRSGGPACMCVSGMSEAEIEAAERERDNTDSDRQSRRQDP